VRDEFGVVKRFAGIADDITARTVDTQHHDRLTAILENSGDVVAGITVDGVIIAWNHAAERQYGYAADEVMGKSISVLFAPDQMAEYARNLDRVRRGERIASYDTIRQKKDGSLTHVAVSVVAIRSPAGEVIGASIIGHDITRIKAMEAQLIAGQKAGSRGSAGKRCRARFQQHPGGDHRLRRLAPRIAARGREDARGRRGRSFAPENEAPDSRSSC
jgi:PAS domain S-box-containing protein